jgi:hypothetical protein
VVSSSQNIYSGNQKPSLAVLQNRIYLYCLPVIGPSGYGGAPSGPRSSSPLSPGPLTGFVSWTGSCGSPWPSGAGGVLVPGPPLRSQSSQEPRYSPTFSLVGVADGKEEWDAPGLSGDASCCTAPHTCFAEKHHFLVWGRLREAKSVLEVFFG